MAPWLAIPASRDSGRGDGGAPSFSELTEAPAIPETSLSSPSNKFPSIVIYLSLVVSVDYLHRQCSNTLTISVARDFESYHLSSVLTPCVASVSHKPEVNNALVEVKVIVIFSGKM